MAVGCPGVGAAQSDWSAVVQAVGSAHRVLLVLHVRPDGDSLGCALATSRALRALGKQTAVVCADPLPSNLMFLDREGECRPPADVRGPFDLALFFDCADLERIGEARSLLSQVGLVVNVDHHPSNARYADINYVETEAAACAEIALRLLSELAAPVDAVAATALYTALATDTGGFRYENTRAETLAAAARLVAAGADVAQIGREVWASRSLASLRLLQAALRTLAVDSSGKVAWISLSRAVLHRVGAEPGDTEGLVDYPRSLRGVEVAILFVVDRPGEVRVSLRSKSCVDVSQVAQRFGGGGHARAAGCTVRGPLAQVRAAVIAAAQQAVGAGGGGSPGRP